MKPDRLASFIELYREEVERVFRFHFSRSGDWALAQALTAETFFDAMRFYDPRRIGLGRKRIWLWRVAVLAHDRRASGLDGSALSGDLLPSQEQVAAYARAAKSAAVLENLPRIEADALALLWFADLLPEEISDILGQDVERLHGLFGHPIDPERRKLAHSLHPVGSFSQHLENDLRERAANQGAPVLSLESPLIWRARYQLRGFFTWSLRILLILVMLYLIIQAWSSFTHSSGFLPLNPTPAGPPTLAPTPTPEFLFHPLVDDLIVADAAGSLRLYSLSGGTYSAQLTEAGFLPDRHLPFNIQPQISPDGKWLAIVRPGVEDTWLVSLETHEQRQISSSAVRLNWAPDGSSAVYVDPLDRRRLDRYQVEKKRTDELLQTSGDQILAAVFSPESDWLAFVTYRTGSRPADGEIGFLVTSQDLHSSWEMSRTPVPAGFSPGRDYLMFTLDGKEIWFPAAHLALNDSSWTIRTLVGEPFADLLGDPFHPSGFGGQPIAPTARVLLSPDRTKIAEVLKRIDNDSPAILAVNRDPLADRFQWITYYGEIDALSWASDSESLFVERLGAAGPLVMRVDADSGANVILLEHTRLVGSRSMLRKESLRFAPRSDLNPLGMTAETDPRKTVSLPGGKVMLRVPQSWAVWQKGDGVTNSSLLLANFSLSDALDWGGLPAGFLTISIQSFNADRDGPRPFETLVKDLVGDGPSAALVRKIRLGSGDAYRLDFPPYDGMDHTIILMHTANGYSMLDATPLSLANRDAFEAVLSTIQVDPTP